MCLRVGSCAYGKPTAAISANMGRRVRVHTSALNHGGTAAEIENTEMSSVASRFTSWSGQRHHSPRFASSAAKHGLALPIALSSNIASVTCPAVTNRSRPAYDAVPHTFRFGGLAPSVVHTTKTRSAVVNPSSYIGASRDLDGRIGALVIDTVVEGVETVIEFLFVCHLLFSSPEVADRPLRVHPRVASRMSTILASVSEESGVPVADLTTVSGMFPGLTGPAYEEMVTLAPHVVHGSDSERAWYAYTWRSHMAGRRAERSRGRVEPWPSRSQ